MRDPTRYIMASSWEEIRPSLSKNTLSVLRESGFVAPTPVQSLVLPHFLSNKDVAVQAVTGSGKTLAFVIPVIEKLKSRKPKWKKGETGAIAVLPTRELAVQVSEVFNLFLAGSGLSLRQLIGGCQEVAKDIQLINEEGGTVVVATPGRLADLLERRDCQLAAGVRSLEILVLDEADRLLDLGFEATLNTILSYLPKQRRTGLFSATLRHEVELLIRGGLRNPINISLSSDTKDFTVPESLVNYFVETPADIKLTHLITFLSCRENEKLLVFCATCAGVNYYSEIIKKLLPSLTVLALHGKMREKRQSLFESFMTLENGVLLCTDVMARGIDIPDVDWVVQFDPPSSEKTFIHRCGRTARMGKNGCSLTYLVPPSELAYVEYMRISEGVVLDALPERETGMLPRSRDLIERIRTELSKEREMYDKSVRAFVSFVRFYSKHNYHLIFNIKALDLVSLAYGTFALLHLPKMPELKGRDTSRFQSHPIDLESIPYKDKGREKQALALRKKKEAAWIAKIDTRKKKLKTKSREERRIARKSTRQKKHTFSASELDELAQEARLLKRYKAGKISKEVLEEQLD